MGGEVLSEQERERVEFWRRSIPESMAVTIIDRLSTELSAAREDLAKAKSVDGVCEAYEAICTKHNIVRTGTPIGGRPFVSYRRDGEGLVSMAGSLAECVGGVEGE